MKKAILLLLLVPMFGQAQVKKRSLTKEAKVKTVIGIGAAAILGLVAYEAYKSYHCDLYHNPYFPLDLGKEKVKETIKYLVGTLLAGVLGHQVAYQVTSDGKIDRAKAYIAKVNPHVIEICKKCNDSEVFFQEINKFFFYSHFPLITAFAQLDQFDALLVDAEELLLSASDNGQLFDECNVILDEVKEMRRALVDAMLVLKNHPDWSIQMNKVIKMNNRKLKRLDSYSDCCERGFCN